MRNDLLQIEKIMNGALDNELRVLYPNRGIHCARERYGAAAARFLEIYGREAAFFVCAPGRCEIIGNHTDHQNGRVIACAVDLDCLCLCAENNRDRIRVYAEGFVEFDIQLDSLRGGGSAGEHDSSKLVRGLAVWFRDKGYTVPGFDAYIVSDVLPGSGLSSSAAYAVAAGFAVSRLCGAELAPVDIAKAAQFAENNYMNKPSGLMDQAASACGGFLFIDFERKESPVIRGLDWNFADFGYNICVTDTRGSHAGLTAEYAAIPKDMKKVAAFFGKETLREVKPDEARRNLREIAETAGIRAALRALHFFEEDNRAALAAEAAANGDIKGFLSLINESGLSCETKLFNITPQSRPEGCELALALAVSREMAGSPCACRVHGGGFAGTVIAFVHNDDILAYESRMNDVFGDGAARRLSIRQRGAFLGELPE